MEPATSFWQRPLFWGIRRWELVAFLGMHTFLGFLYWCAILLTSGQNQAIGISINYLFKILFTAPVWWLFFRRLRHWNLRNRILLHLPLCLLYVFTWKTIFYATSEAIGIGHLDASGSWWDVYIPILVYLLQFGVFHAYEYWCEILRQKEKEKSLMRLAHAAEMSTLKAQIQPHFLFNTLNSISASVPAAQEHTRTLIAQLADVFRFAMNVSDKEFITLGQEMEFIRNFLALEQQRFGDRLSVYYHFDETLSDYPVPPMLLQPLVENAVKHGIAKSLEGGSISVRVQKDGGSVQFEVADTGKGINGYQPGQLFTKGIGLENTRQRIQKLYGAPLSVQPNEPVGFRVLFALPLQPHPEWNKK
ncbi:Histidine kinase-, DNA gyrase B-, and HSP90-like ATPase [Cnuella takakiae]|uniref:Histidine kinase-, DNA gyrase B-, and HSP90-like ATPase n=1 Tax=Cnuella takakiae TaxID=1302690 RepID=A0A1M5GSY7_9BACT|nr:histidine kinase [Cnuella takakiae]OLY90903.1 hypothetical protein BUE76_02575 [Cnuella takakiae]SHG06727.1 Histidine kinase-, DNA gyrase B-, and HSP90-like ATPase [Cnuella takakiae]